MVQIWRSRVCLRHLKKKIQAFVSQACKLFLTITFPQKLGVLLVFPDNHSTADHLGIEWLKSLVCPSCSLHTCHLPPDWSCLNQNLQSEGSILDLPLSPGTSSHYLPGKSSWGCLRKAGLWLSFLCASSLEPEPPLITSMNSWLSHNFGKRQEAADSH